MLNGDEVETTTTTGRNVANDVLLQAKVKAMLVAAAAITGESPQAINRGEYVEIIFTPKQKELMQSWIVDNLLKKPGDVRIDYYGIALPPIIKVYGKIALLALVAAYVLGKISR